MPVSSSKDRRFNTHRENAHYSRALHIHSFLTVRSSVKCLKPQGWILEFESCAPLPGTEANTNEPRCTTQMRRE